MVLHALENAWGGEIFVPKIPSYKIADVARAIGPDCKHEIVGIRPGEKIHEAMITESDSYTTYDLGKYYVILPQVPLFDKKGFISHFSAQKVKENFSYNSGMNDDMLSVDEIRSLIKKNVDPNFNIS